MSNGRNAKRLLIVDDEPAIVHMLDGYFRMQGYETVCAHAAQEALAAVNDAVAHGRSIDLALLDVNMPGMDGFELCRRLREALSCPIIFLTARIEDTDQLDGFAAGAAWRCANAVRACFRTSPSISRSGRLRLRRLRQPRWTNLGRWVSRDQHLRPRHSTSRVRSSTSSLC